jgi:hypothetical protein
VIAVRRRQGLTRHTSACFRSRAPGPVSGQLYETPPAGETGDRRLPLSCCLSATGIRFLGVLFPPRDSASLTVGLPPHPRCGGPDGVATFHTHELRPGRVPAIPREQRCPHDRRSVLGRRPPIHNGPLLVHPHQHDPTWGVAVTRHHHWFAHAHPFGLPLTCDTRSERAPLGFPWASHPAITGRARQRRGSVQDTDRSHVFDIESNLQSTELLITCDIVSHRIAAYARR